MNTARPVAGGPLFLVVGDGVFSPVEQAVHVEGLAADEERGHGVDWSGGHHGPEVHVLGGEGEALSSEGGPVPHQVFPPAAEKEGGPRLEPRPQVYEGHASGGHDHAGYGGGPGARSVAPLPIEPSGDGPPGPTEEEGAGEGRRT